MTEEEIAEKETLAESGFPDWQRRHLQMFIKGLERYGRDNLEDVTTEVVGKTVDDVRAYSAVFFERYTEIKGGVFVFVFVIVIVIARLFGAGRNELKN